jgi:hypothetical protein
VNDLIADSGRLVSARLAREGKCRSAGSVVLSVGGCLVRSKLGGFAIRFDA